MDNQIIYQWQVTKYNPDYRNENGHYTLAQEWTCPSEIGNFIEGKVFTLKEYLSIESAYVKAIVNFMKDSGIDSLRIIGLEVNVTEADKSSILYESEFDHLTLDEDVIISESEVRTIAKMVLRNFIWCQFYSKGNFFVHFGWDYYMYIGSAEKCLSAIKSAEENGLFVEQYKSPYYFTEEEATRMIQWNEIDAEVIVGDEELIGIPLEKYRNILNLSEEHPVIGSFEITKEKSKFFQRYLEHKIDFTKYEYWFWGGK